MTPVLWQEQRPFPAASVHGSARLRPQIANDPVRRSHALARARVRARQATIASLSLDAAALPPERVLPRKQLPSGQDGRSIRLALERTARSSAPPQRRDALLRRLSTPARLWRSMTRLPATAAVARVRWRRAPRQAQPRGSQGLPARLLAARAGGAPRHCGLAKSCGCATA